MCIPPPRVSSSLYVLLMSRPLRSHITHSVSLVSTMTIWLLGVRARLLLVFAIPSPNRTGFLPKGSSDVHVLVCSALYTHMPILLVRAFGGDLPSPSQCTLCSIGAVFLLVRAARFGKNKKIVCSVFACAPRRVLRLPFSSGPVSHVWYNVLETLVSKQMKFTGARVSWRACLEL